MSTVFICGLVYRFGTLNISEKGNKKRTFTLRIYRIQIFAMAYDYINNLHFTYSSWTCYCRLSVIRKREQRLLFVGCLMSQQHASVSQGRICSDNCMCCQTEIEVADQTFYLTQTSYASVSQGRICSDNFTCCHSEAEAASQTF